MDRLRCDRSSDLDGRSLRITGPDHRAGQRRSTKERDGGRARLDRVEGRDSWRTGPSRTRIQDVPLGADGTLIPITGVIGDNGIFPVTAQTLF